MDLSFAILTSWQFVLFCLGIAALTFVVRKVVEYFLDKPEVPVNKTSKIWTELLLPIGPVISGAVLGFLFKEYPYPEGISSDSARMFFGLVAGLFSGLAYKIVKGLLTKKADEVTSELENKDLSKLAETVKDSITKE